MFGLMVLGAAALYLGLMFVVVRWAWRRGRANGGSMLKASLFALLGILLVYLPVFWNHIPVLLAHRSMCAKDAGFKAYVTPEQWAEMNKAAIAGISQRSDEQRDTTRKQPDGLYAYDVAGGLLTKEYGSTSFELYGVRGSRGERRLRDTKSGSLLYVSVDYYVGNREDISSWHVIGGCFSDKDARRPRALEDQFMQQIREITK